MKENPNGPTGLYSIDQFTYMPQELYSIDQFTYMPQENCYICPEGKPLKYVGINPRDHAHL